MTKIKILNRQKWADLKMYTRDKKTPREDRDYKYLITNNNTSHTAFHTRKGLNSWLKDTGVRIGEKIPHLHNTRNLRGKEVEISLAGDRKSFDRFCKDRKLRESKILNNGDYTKSCIKNKKGGNEIYYLNPNYDRKIYKYKYE